MRIKTTGRVGPDFYITGVASVPVYLLDGSVPVLFDAGFTVFAQKYVADIRAVLGRRAPKYLFITHAHFDHVGSAGYFKQIWPELQIVGSARCRDILQRPGANKLIAALNKEGAQAARAYASGPFYDAPYEPIAIDVTAAPDEQFELWPGVSVQALEMPGHTWDFMSYWIEAKKILVSSEISGCDDGTGYIQTEFLVDFDRYIESIERLSHFDAQVLCAGHLTVTTGDDVPGYLRRSADSARRYLSMVEGFLRETDGDVETAVIKVKAMEWDDRPWPKQPEEAYLINTRQRVQKTWERMQIKA